MTYPTTCVLTMCVGAWEESAPFSWHSHTSARDTTLKTLGKQQLRRIRTSKRRTEPRTRRDAPTKIARCKRQRSMLTTQNTPWLSNLTTETNLNTYFLKTFPSSMLDSVPFLQSGILPQVQKFVGCGNVFARQRNSTSNI